MVTRVIKRPKPRFKAGDRAVDLNGKPGTVMAVGWSFAYQFDCDDGESHEALQPDEIFGSLREFRRARQALRRWAKRVENRGRER